MDGPTQDLLDLTRDAAAKDRQTVEADGTMISTQLEGVTTHSLTTHVDSRGEVCEIYDPRWQVHPGAMVYAYQFTVLPGVVKGWGLHETYDDRYVILNGCLDVILYDVRPDSSTCGKVQRVSLTHYDRKVLVIPAFVWHADHNVGTETAQVVNFPSKAYDHSVPDKMRLPFDTDLIPWTFRNARGE